MAYGDISDPTGDYRAPSKGGTETIRHAVVLKDSSTIIPEVASFIASVENSTRGISR